jgi:Na+/melibiose symporter-like transporter
MLAIAVIEGPRWGWESIGSVSAFVASALSTLLFVLRQKGSDGALMPLAMFNNRAFSASLGIAAAMTFGMYAMLFLTPLYLQAERGDGALQAAVELLPMSLTFVIVSQLSGKIANAYGPRLPMTLGMAMMGTGLFMLALVPLSDSLLLIEAALFVIGCGLGLNTAPVNGVAVANAPTGRSGTASGLVNTARMVGATLGVAVLGAIFAVFAGGSGSGHVARGLPPAFLVGGIGEMLGAAVAFTFIRRDSLREVARH